MGMADYLPKHPSENIGIEQNIQADELTNNEHGGLLVMKNQK